jgi:hypothetical protein
MKLKLIVSLAACLALLFAPVTASAHEGHDHGAKSKKVKKSKKTAGGDSVVAWRIG